jgi:hypothetical protein
MGVILALLLTMVVVGAPVGAEATGFKITVTAPSSQRPPAEIHRAPVIRHRVVPRVPVVVVPQPVVVVSPRRCLEPGYWAYNWIPQSYVSNAWVPGYYDFNALWIEGHYEPRAYTWGYYQPYWVPERWAHC